MILPEPTFFVDCDPVTQNVVKAVNAPYIPPHVPPFALPPRRPDPIRLKNADYVHPTILDDDLFYLAFLPKSAFRLEGHSSTFTECFQYTRESLPLSPVDGKAWELRRDVCMRWMSFEDLLESAIIAIQAVVTREVFGQATQHVGCVRIRPRDYGYCQSIGNKESMRDCIWSSRNAFVALMAYLSFLVATCRCYGHPEIGRAHV